MQLFTTYEPNYEKTNIVVSAKSIDPDQTLFASCGFSVSGIITLYLYPP